MTKNWLAALEEDNRISLVVWREGDSLNMLYQWEGWKDGEAEEDQDDDVE